VGEWIDLPPISAMEIFAKGTQNNKINLLSGEFKAKKEKNQLVEKWRMPIVIAASLFFLLMFNLYLKNAQVQKETLLVKQHIEVIYKQAFPLQSQLKYARIKKKLKSLVASLEGNVDSSFLSMLNELVPAFTDNSQFKANNIKFDSKKQELKISANADNFQLFEKFNTALAENFRVEQGALSNSKEGVSGQLSIRNK
jgi:general secretion pathway protein L